MEQLSLWATTTQHGLQSPGATVTEAVHSRAQGPQQEKPEQREASAPLLEKAQVQQQKWMNE